jgi:hypothetical protein
MTLVYTDSPAGVVGFIDITILPHPPRPAPSRWTASRPPSPSPA